YVDAGYAARREALTIVCLACREIPSPACFCDSMGGSPADAAGADVLLTEADDGSGMICEAKTEKGEAVLALWEKLLEKKEPKKPKTPACTLSVKKPDDLAEKLVRNFDDEQWTRFSEPCMACGCCTYVCPTCYCFDIAFEKEGTAADAFRSWDSCLFPKYSLMAGGHNPRWMKTQRLRNRYLHKLSYFDERYGKTLCVGCGRCIENCSQGLDITRVIEWGGTL
ncbi:MAG: 4Fe-4S dicluster domain-containing protein, partial [Clostridiales bacterium]|nr:4Fe-4S dicluster domain-containing protein [Clostridiales bacterium]